MLTAIIAGDKAASGEAPRLDALQSYLRRAGISHEIVIAGSQPAIEPETDELRIIPAGEGPGAALRRAVSEARGEIIAIVEPGVVCCVEELGHAIAVIDARETDLVLVGGDAARQEGSERLGRLLLQCDATAARAPMRVYSHHAGRVLFAESRLNSCNQPFELLFLANRYGFRVTRIPLAGVTADNAGRTPLREVIRDFVRVRRHDRALAYRAPRRCPVCFSSSVRSAAQVPGHVVRACDRCKCRYLADLPSEDDLESAWSPPVEPRRTPSTSKTNEAQLRLLKRLVPPGSRVLEVGAGDGSFGTAVAREYDYIGIDPSDANARRARAAGVQVYRSTLSRFVNIGTPFDAVVLFRVFEYLPDPHDALARLRELLKPGGYLLMVTPDTESLSVSMAADRWTREKFPEHVIVYSRSALIELLERSGFEITSAGAFMEYRDHESLRADAARFGVKWAARLPLAVLPDPLPVSSGAIRVVARRRAGPPTVPRGIRSVEPTHAR